MSNYDSESEESIGDVSVANSLNFQQEQEDGFAGAGPRPVVDDNLELEDEADFDVAEPYRDEPLADEEWIQRYQEEVRVANEEEARLRRRLDGTDLVENWCSCGHCSIEKLMNPQECKCCKEIEGCSIALIDVEVVEEFGQVPPCVTLHPGFNPVYLS